MLYRVLGKHLETFTERTKLGGRGLPAFVKKELRGSSSAKFSPTVSHVFITTTVDMITGHQLFRAFGFDEIEQISNSPDPRSTRGVTAPSPLSPSDAMMIPSKVPATLTRTCC